MKQSLTSQMIDGVFPTKAVDIGALSKVARSRRCPKCKATSGDDWSQCRGDCPMPMSPHYSTTVAP